MVRVFLRTGKVLELPLARTVQLTVPRTVRPQPDDELICLDRAQRVIARFRVGDVVAYREW